MIRIQIFHIDKCICSPRVPRAIWPNHPLPPPVISGMSHAHQQKATTEVILKWTKTWTAVSPINGFVNGSTQPDQDERFSHAGSPVSVRNNRVKGGLCPSSPGEFLSFSSFSQSASSSEATHPGASRMCAVGPLCSRKVTRIMPNIMTTQFSSLARASVPRACRVRCCYQGECALSSGRRSSIYSRYWRRLILIFWTLCLLFPRVFQKMEKAQKGLFNSDVYPCKHQVQSSSLKGWQTNSSQTIKEDNLQERASFRQQHVGVHDKVRQAFRKPLKLWELCQHFSLFQGAALYPVRDKSTRLRKPHFSHACYYYCFSYYSNNNNNNNSADYGADCNNFSLSVYSASFRLKAQQVIKDPGWGFGDT